MVSSLPGLSPLGDRDGWVRRAREAALAWRNRGLPREQHTELPRPRCQVRAAEGG